MIRVPLEDLTDQHREGSVFIHVDGTHAEVYYSGDEIPPAPSEHPTIVVRLTQFRIALERMNLLATVNSAVAQADKETQVWWEYSVDAYSDNPRIQAMAASLGMSQAQVRAVFELAQTINY